VGEVKEGGGPSIALDCIQTLGGAALAQFFQQPLGDEAVGRLADAGLELPCGLAGVEADDSVDLARIETRSVSSVWTSNRSSG
jgi:hypothetical protein